MTKTLLPRFRKRYRIRVTTTDGSSVKSVPLERSLMESMHETFVGFNKEGTMWLKINATTKSHFRFDKIVRADIITTIVLTRDSE